MSVLQIETDDERYVALLTLADTFLNKCQPPDVKSCVRCLQAILRIQDNVLPPLTIARTHLQLARVLITHTNNLSVAKNHLELAWSHLDASPDCLPLDLNVTCEIACSLTFYIMLNNESDSAAAKNILSKAVSISQPNNYWHSRILFQMANIYAQEKDYSTSIYILTQGVSYSVENNFTRVLFMLSKTMLYLLERNFGEANPILHEVGPTIENWSSSSGSSVEGDDKSILQSQKEHLQIFFLVLQVAYYLMLGQIKSVKGALKQLQMSSGTKVSESNASHDLLFEWLSKEKLCILIYILTVMHSMQAGYMDIAKKYTDRALIQIDKMINIDKCSNFVSYSARPHLSHTFRVILLEHTIQCDLVVGHTSSAILNISQITDLLYPKKDGVIVKSPFLTSRHSTQLHTLIALYAMSHNQLDHAENHLSTALRTSQDRELWTFVNLNLAIVYLRCGRETDFMGLLDRISPETLPSQSHALRAASYYIQGLHAFFHLKYHDAKRFLRETLKMANGEDLNRLTCSSLVLLSHIFLVMGNSTESMNTVTPALQLASKIPDVSVQLWASAILKELYRASGDSVRCKEGEEMHATFSHQVLTQLFTSSQLTQHSIVEWSGNLADPIFNPTSIVAKSNPTVPEINPPSEQSSSSVDFSAAAGSSTVAVSGGQHQSVGQEQIDSLMAAALAQYHLSQNVNVGASIATHPDSMQQQQQSASLRQFSSHIN